MTRSLPTSLLLVAVLWSSAQTQPSSLLPQIPSIALPGVEGRIDHLAVDVAGKRLFVAALGNNTLEVIDLAASKVINRIAGLKEPQGVAYLPPWNKVVVANGGDGSLRIFNGKTLRLMQRVALSSDADNVRFDPLEQLLYVGHGKGALSIIDAVSSKVVGKVELPGHPESFQLEKAGPRIFINVPSARQIIVVNRATRTVADRWPLEDLLNNYPMALDETNHRLFIVTRKPARLVVLDTQSGKHVTELNTVGDADDIFYDAAHKRLYVTGGEGFIRFIGQSGPDEYKDLGGIVTALGARTALFVPEMNRVFVAVPHRGDQRAEIRVFEVR